MAISLPSSNLYINCKRSAGLVGARNTDGRLLLETWQDQSGGGRDLTASGGARPFVEPAAPQIEGLPGVGFVYSPDTALANYLTSPTISLNTRDFGVFLSFSNYNGKPHTGAGSAYNDQILWILLASGADAYTVRLVSTSQSGSRIQIFDGAGDIVNTGCYPHSGRNFIGWVSNGANTQILCNDQWVTGGGAAGAATGTSFKFGGASPGWTAAASIWGRIDEIAVYNAAPSAAAIQQIRDYFYSAYRVPRSRDAIVVFDGDSIMAGYNAYKYDHLTSTLETQTYLRNVNNLMGSMLTDIPHVNVGCPSAQLNTLTTNFTARVTTPYLRQGGDKRILVIAAGTNDISTGGLTGAQVKTRLDSYIASARADGWNYIIAATLSPRGNSGSNSTHETARQAYNTLIRASAYPNAGYTIDAVWDVGGDALMGQNGQQDSATGYFADGTHWSDRGHQRAADLLRPILAAAMEYNTVGNIGGVMLGHRDQSPLAASVLADVRKWQNTQVATPDAAGYPKVTLKSGSGAGEVSLSSGAVTVGANNDKSGYGLADGAITAAKVAADAIGASQVAASAVTEIQAGLSTLTAAQVRTEMDSNSTKLAALRDLLEADRVIDTTVTPWALVLLKQGSGGLGVGEELLRQSLFDVTGANVHDTTTVLGRSVA